MHKTIKKVTQDVEKLSFNTAISSLMIFSNALAASSESPPRDALEALVLLVSPFAPHVAEECWALLGHSSSLAYHPWPEYQEELCVDSTVIVPIQVNGKVRGKVELDRDAGEKEALRAALLEQSVQKYVPGEDSVTKLIYVPGKILNIIAPAPVKLK